MNEELSVIEQEEVADLSELTPKEIRAKIKEMSEALDYAEEREKNEILEDLDRKLEDKGYTLRDIGLAKIGKKRGKKRVLAPKYKNPETGDTWSGVGREPKWITESGKKKENFAIG